MWVDTKEGNRATIECQRLGSLLCRGFPECERHCTRQFWW